jgi:Skp family chaperone for outer membrane proteins
MRSLTAAAVLFSAAALAQTNGGSSAALPAAPSVGDPPAVTGATGSKIGTINVEGAIFASNEGQRDFDILSKKLEPKQNELKAKNEEIDGLKKQLNTQGDKLNEEAKNGLTKQIEPNRKLWSVTPRTPRRMRATKRTRLRSAFCRRWRP